MERSAIHRCCALLLLCALSACGGGTRRAVVDGGYTPSGSYAPPGPPGDPWGPYIYQASKRFDVPQAWIRAVIHQESGGRQYAHGQPITSDAGAMGLMQILPATYSELSARYGLGSDPYEPHDNIMAGTGYVRELYERYGSPAFLAAYNAGPHRLDLYLSGRGSLPNETVNYLASIGPSLGSERPVSGPLAAFAGNGVSTSGPVLHDYVRTPAGCWTDPDAAYDPDAPCRTQPPPHAGRPDAVLAQAASAPAPRRAAPPQSFADAAPAPREAVQVAPAAYAAPAAAQRAYVEAGPTASTLPPPTSYYASAAPAVAASVAPAAPMAASRGGCRQDPDAAYDPDAPCTSAPAGERPARVQLARAGWGTGEAPPGRVAPYRPATTRYAGSLLISSAAAATMAPSSGGRWSIQMGAFTSREQARQAAESVRTLAPQQLGGARTVLGATAPFGGQVLYRARLSGLSAQNANLACRQLEAASHACVSVPPGG